MQLYHTLNYGNPDLTDFTKEEVILEFTVENRKFVSRNGVRSWVRDDTGEYSGSKGKTSHRDGLYECLKSFTADFYYPHTLSFGDVDRDGLQEMYADLGLEKGTFPHAERAASEVLSLPAYPELGDEQIEEVAMAIRQFYGRRP